MSNFRKIAVEVLPGMEPIGGTTPKGTPHQQSRTRAYQGSVSGRPSSDEKQQVIRMQTIMSAFATAISQDKAAIAERFGIDDGEIERISGAISDTGGQQTFDGLWGPKTIAGLSEVARLSKAMGTMQVNPGKHYKEVKNPENIISAAKSNIDAIAELMRQIGLARAVPAEAGARPEYYDVIQETLNRGNLGSRVSQGEDGVAVRPSHLDNIWSFYRLLKNDIYADLSILSEAAVNNDIEKLAQQVRDASIVKEIHAQRRPLPSTMAQGGRGETAEDIALNQRGDALMEASQAREAADDIALNQRGDALMKANQVGEASRAYQGPSDVSVAKFDAVLSWFKKRTNMLYRAVEDDYRSGATRQDESGKIAPISSKQDVKSAADYYRAVDRLADTWDEQRDSFLKDETDPMKSIVDPSKLFEYKNVGKRRRGGYGRDGDQSRARRDGDQSRARRDSDGTDREGFSLVRKYPNGPIQRNMHLQRMASDMPNTESARWLRENLKIMSIEREFFRTRPAKLINSVLNKSDMNPKVFVQLLTEKLSNVFGEMYGAWEADASSLPSGISSRLISKQLRELQAWNDSLSVALSSANDWDVAGRVMPRSQSRMR